MANKRITVIVDGPAHVAEIVKREVATALSQIGAFHVTAQGEFFNGDPSGCNTERMELLGALAADGTEIYVRRK